MRRWCGWFSGRSWWRDLPSMDGSLDRQWPGTTPTGNVDLWAWPPPEPSYRSVTVLPWRVGRKVGRTIYDTSGPDGDGRLIGVMDTPGLAAMVVDAVNQAHDTTEADSG